MHIQEHPSYRGPLRSLCVRFAWQFVVRSAEQTMIQAFRDDTRFSNDAQVRPPLAVMLLPLAIFALAPYGIVRPYALALWIAIGHGPGLHLFTYHVGGRQQLTRGLKAIDFSRFRISPEQEGSSDRAGVRRALSR
jgi:hypothetical protein